MRRHQSAGGPDQLQGHVYQMHTSKLVYNFIIDGGIQHCFSRFDNKQIWCIAADSIPQNCFPALQIVWRHRLNKFEHTALRENWYIQEDTNQTS